MKKKYVNLLYRHYQENFSEVVRAQMWLTNVCTRAGTFSELKTEPLHRVR